MKRAPVLHPVPQLPRTVIIRSKIGLVQAFGVFIDTIVICSCTAMIMLLAPEELIAGLAGNGSASDGYEAIIWASSV